MPKSLETIINYNFKDRALLQAALTHPSYLNEHPQGHESYQRLEFLGDAVLELLASRHLFSEFPQTREGRLTEIRAALVRTENLAKLAKQINLGDFLLLSKGEEHNLGRQNENILADALEALIGAIYLDSSIEQAQAFFLAIFKAELKNIVKHKLYWDAKTKLQEVIQAKYKQTPIYKSVNLQSQSVPGQFQVGVFLQERCLGIGTGKNKRLAEQLAAQAALGKLKVI